MDKKFVILAIVTIILLLCNIFFVVKYFSGQKKINEIAIVNHIDNKIKFFNNIFIDKVLKATEPVSYEDRLKLENAVVDTNDKKIINQWHKLLESQTEEEAQKGVVELLVLFAR